MVTLPKLLSLIIKIKPDGIDKGQSHRSLGISIAYGQPEFNPPNSHKVPFAPPGAIPECRNRNML